MSSFLNNPFSRVIDIGLANVFEHVVQQPKRGISTKIQDYMHLSDFKDLVDKARDISSVVQISPVSLLGFTQENQREILLALLGGAPLDTALKLNKIKKNAYQTWVRLAENHVEPFVSFVEECDAAMAYFDMELIQKMRNSKMHIVELWKLRYPETMLGNQQGNVQNVNINFIDKPAAERAADIKGFISDIDPSQVYNYPVKDADEE